MTAVQGANRQTTWLVRRWPTAAGGVMAVSLAAAFWLRFAESQDVAQILTAAGFVYLGAAALGRRVAAWPLFGVTFVLITVGFLLPGFDPTWWMLGLAAGLVVYGLVRGALRPPWGMPLQVGVMILIVAVVLSATQIGRVWAGVLVGVGLLAHAGWDVYHHRVRRVVARSMAEFCCVLDALLAVSIVATSLLR